jgi:hypothetical protein
MQRDLKVVAKGLRGKGFTIPFVTFANNEGEKLTVNLATKQQLIGFEIDQQITVNVSNGPQKSLS